MSPENKQRIVGVVVLVAFVALLTPFLFTSGIKKKLPTSDEIPIDAQKRQMITEQIRNINDSTAPAVQEQQQQVQQPVPTALPEALPAVSPTDISTLPPLPAESVEPLDMTPQAVVEPIVTKSIKPAEPEPEPIVADIVKKEKVKNIKKESWTVQIGSFSDQSRVKKLIEQLHKKGFSTHTQKIMAGTESLTRVFIGQEASKKKADKLGERLEATMKIKGRVVRNKK